jgi:L-arabinose transport system substrate-binding protein
MSLARRSFLAGTAATALAVTGSLLTGCSRRASGVRIGFILKQPEEQWFQSEWHFAGLAARDRGFELLRIGATDGERVLTAIDDLYAKYAQGFVICAPDPNLGTAIRQLARAYDLKVLSVDDRLLGSDGRPLPSIPYVGISASAIGAMAGREAVDEAQRRGWDLSQTGVLRLAYDSLETSRERTTAGARATIAAGIPAGQVYSAPQRTTDTEGGFTGADPVLTQHRAIHQWIVLGLNDEAVLGGVRAAEGAGFDADTVIGVGIGGSGTADAEFSKPRRTGFHASVLLSARKHGYDTTSTMYDWIVHGIEPPLVTYSSGIVMTRENFRPLLREEAA